jgi:hypothetical protein
MLKKLANYDENELLKLIERYKKASSKEREFEMVFGVKIKQDDFENFWKKKIISENLMALFLNVLQDEDQSRFDLAKTIYYDLVEVDYSKEKFPYKISTENLTLRQFNPD